MARKRMIDPGIWSSEDFSKLTSFSKLVFIGLFSLADDEGRGKANPSYLKSMLFPYEEGIRSADIKKTLQEIASTMSVIFYTHDEKEYYALKSWGRFQTINRPSPSDIPDPASDSVSTHGGLSEDSVNAHGGLTPKIKGKEEKRKEEKGKESPVGKPPARFIPPTVEEVAAYCRKHGYDIDAEAFVSYYTANGWVQGRGRPIKDWKACVRTWVARQKERVQTTIRGKTNPMMEREYSQDELREMIPDSLSEMEDE